MDEGFTHHKRFGSMPERTPLGSDRFRDIPAGAMFSNDEDVPSLTSGGVVAIGVLGAIAVLMTLVVAALIWFGFNAFLQL